MLLGDGQGRTTWRLFLPYVFLIILLPLYSRLQLSSGLRELDRDRKRVKASFLLVYSPLYEASLLDVA
jgi:hypothetical protein